MVIALLELGSIGSGFTHNLFWVYNLVDNRLVQVWSRWVEMGYPTTVQYKGETYDLEVDYQFWYLYGLAEIGKTYLLDEIGLEHDIEEDWDEICDMEISQEIPEDEKLVE
jgi:hypothetical protein